MASNKEVSSTEKLLDVIRSKKTSSASVKTPGSPPSEKKSKLPVPEMLRSRKTVSIGIDIDTHSLKLIKVVRSPDNEWKLLAHSIVPLKPDIPRDAPEFTIFLRSELYKFCGPAGKFNLWANMPSALVEVASVRIPKVARKQIENAVYWTAKKTMSFKEKEVILDFEIGDEVVENGVRKLAAMVYTAPLQEVRELQRLFENIGYPLDGLVIAPFGTQNLFKTNWIPALDQTVATLDIGMDWSRINIFSRGNLVITRSIRTGVDSMAQEFMEGYNESVERASFEESRIEPEPSVPGDFAGDGFMKIEDARNLLLGLSPDSPSSEDIGTRFKFDEEDIIKWISPAVDRLVRQIDRTFQHSTVTLRNEKVSAIYISTLMNVCKPLVDCIGDDLEIEEGVLDPLEPGGPLTGDITSALSVPDRISLVPALGAALSGLSRTPNLLFTYKDKETRSNIEKGNRIMFATAAAVLLVCVVVLFTMTGIANEKKAVITKLEQQLKQDIVVDENIIPIFVSKVKDDRDHVREYGERYLGIAAIKELSVITPSNICLLHVTANMGGTPAEKGSKRAGSVTIEGVVSGGMDSLEDSLVAYVLKLQSSPVFSQAKITKSNVESFENVEVLRFILNVKFSKGII